MEGESMSGNAETTCELVRRNAAQYPDTPFLNFYDETITYRELDERTNAFASYLLEKGVGRGDVVSYMLGNSPAVFDVLLGAQKIGAVGGPISCWWQANEVEYLVNDSRSKVLLVDPEYVPVAAELADVTPSVEQILVNAPSAVDLGRPHECLPAILAGHATDPPQVEPPRPEDTAALMYTSGTTGKPKGVMLSHRGVLAGARIKTERVPISPADRGLCVLPLFHSGGLNDLAFPTMYRAATIVLRRGFSASEFWDCIERYRVNAFYIVPTMWNILLRATESSTVDTSSLRFGISGAAPIPPEQLEECKVRFGVPILEAYGLTESSGGIAANTLERSKYGSVGLPFEGLEVRVFDPDEKPLPADQIGEIAVRGEVMMQGYWGRADATTRTGSSSSRTGRRR
jgi:long-chain acyl-CoA synthetase